MKAHSPFSVRNVAADMFAMVVFCFVTGMLTEVVISGISFETSLASRTLAIPVNILIALPYGIFRDRVMKLAAKMSATRLMKNAADLFAFVVFQSPVYIAILMVVGASQDQIIAAVTSSIAMFSVLGVLYGYFLDVCRRWFRVPGYYQQI